ncbi:MAG: hypothetical protein ABIQ30_02525 [Devosia sp.]
MPASDALLRMVLVHRQIGDDVLMTLLHSVRHGAEDVRFSPVIVLTDECPFEVILGYIRMGADDVIVLPENKDVLVQRFESQITGTHIYYETGDYFGPDRRRMEMTPPDTRRVGVAGHARYHFMRSPGEGIKITRHEVFAAPLRPMMDVA